MPPHTLTSDSAVEPRVAIAASGEGIAAWGVKGSDPAIAGGAVSASVRPPGGRFGAPRLVSPNEAYLLGLAANAAGDAAIGYQVGRTLGAVFRSAFGDWSSPADFASVYTHLVVDGAGNTTIVERWDERVDTATEIQRHVADHLRARTRFADGTLGPWREISSAYRIHGEDAATDAAGNVTVAWRAEAENSAGEKQLLVATAPPGGQFSAPRALAAPRYHNNGSRMRVVANRRGDVLVAWGATPPGYDDRQAGPFPPETVNSSFRPAGGDFGAVEAVDVPQDPFKGLYRWDLAIDDEGGATVAWSNAHHGGVAVRPSSGPWGPMRPLGEFALEPTVAVDGKGTATVAYVDRDKPTCCQPPESHRLMAIRRPRGGAFGKPEQLARAKHVFGPDSAADALGNTIVVWSHQERWASSPDRTGQGIVAVIWDAAAPRVKGFALDPDGEASGDGMPEFDYRLTEAATVSVSIERKAKRPKRIATLTKRSMRGGGALAVGSKVAKRLSARGSYRATIVARDSAGRRSAPRRVSFGSLRR